MPTDVPTILAYLVMLFAVPVRWFVVWRIVHLYRAAPDLGVLQERMVVAVAIAIIVTVFGLVFLNNELDNIVLSTTGTRVVTRSAMLGLALPGLYWLWLYRDDS